VVLVDDDTAGASGDELRLAIVIDVTELDGRVVLRLVPSRRIAQRDAPGHLAPRVGARGVVIGNDAVRAPRGDLGLTVAGDAGELDGRRVLDAVPSFCIREERTAVERVPLAKNAVEYPDEDPARVTPQQFEAAIAIDVRELYGRVLARIGPASGIRPVRQGE